MDLMLELIADTRLLCSNLFIVLDDEAPENIVATPGLAVALHRRARTLSRGPRGLGLSQYDPKR